VKVAACNLSNLAHSFFLEDTALPLHFLDAVLQIIGDEVSRVHCWHEPRSIGKEVVHLFKRPLLGLGLRGPEPEGVGEVAHYEENIEPPADFLHSDRCHLTDHGIECKGDHDADTDAFGTCAGIEDLSRDDPCTIVSQRYHSVYRPIDVYERGPLVAEKLMLYNQVTAMKSQEAEALLVVPGGNTASIIVAIVKKRQLARLSPIMAQRRPTLSMKAMHII